MEELLLPAEMAQADALAANEAALMQAAGRVVARAILRRYRPCRTLVLAGPGNNGGDGRIAADYLSAAGWPVTVLPVAAATVTEVAHAELVIDAVFGAGLSRDVAAPVAGLLRAARRIVAIDVPSGVDGATGTVRGYAAQDRNLLPPQAGAFIISRARPVRRCFAPRYRVAGGGSGDHQATHLAERAMAVVTA
jgi:NAD(P)H-hydrate repair Nnr-like enzyme with NAD(P)H-hydrate epimerase domain